MEVSLGSSVLRLIFQKGPLPQSAFSEEALGLSPGRISPSPTLIPCLRPDLEEQQIRTQDFVASGAAGLRGEGDPSVRALGDLGLRVP